jgi:hypothetical protein
MAEHAPPTALADDRLQATARLLAEAILRRKLREFRRSGRERNSLELSPRTRTHVLETSRIGERAP